MPNRLNILLCSLVGAMLVFLTIVTCFNLGLSPVFAGLVSPCVALVWIYVAIKLNLVYR